MVKAIGLAALLAALAGWLGTPPARVVCDGFLPPNDLKIFPGDSQALNIGEDAFHEVLNRAEALYRPLVAARGGRLVVNREWSNPKVNASAEQSLGVWYINMYGGLARHPAITEEGFALVVCHELGHHLGGFPKKMEGWPTNEGGSDYYATLKCLRRLLPDTAPEKVDPVASAACDEAWPPGPDRNHCKSGAMAGLSAAALFKASRPNIPMPDLAKPDPTVVERTYDKHPAPQCRLDTYFQGALCVKPLTEELSDRDPSPGACTEAGGFTNGLRPLCWYKPRTPDRTSAVARADAPSRFSPLMSENTLVERLNALRSLFNGREF